MRIRRPIEWTNEPDADITRTTMPFWRAINNATPNEARDLTLEMMQQVYNQTVAQQQERVNDWQTYYAYTSKKYWEHIYNDGCETHPQVDEGL